MKKAWEQNFSWKSNQDLMSVCWWAFPNLLLIGFKKELVAFFAELGLNNDMLKDLLTGVQVSGLPSEQSCSNR